MLCILEIASVVYGIMTLVRGRFPVGKTKEVRGPMAYVIGLMLLGVLPVGILIALIMNFDQLKNGGGPQPFKFEAKTVLPDVIAVFGWGGLTIILALVTAQPKLEQRRGRRRDAEYDDYEDQDEMLRRAFRRRNNLDDDDRPRRRRRDDEHDDEDDRPRRKRDDLDDRAR
jgi:hypothetical protein